MPVLPAHQVTRRQALAAASGLLATVLLAACGAAAPAASPSVALSAKPAGASAAAPSAAGPASGAAKPGGARNSLTVAFGVPVGGPSNPFAWIGKALGYFDEENIEVEFANLGGDNAKGVAMLASGQIDIGIFGLEQILRGVAAGNGVEARSVYNVQTKSQYEGIVAEDSPVKTMQDLKGKTVAIPQLGATLETYVNQALLDAGMAIGDVKFLATNIGPPMGEALKRGEVSAAFGTKGQITPLGIQGYKFRYLPRPSWGDQLITGNVVARANMPADRLAALKGYLKAYSKGIVFSKANPEAAMLVNWKMYPEAKPKGIAEADALKQAVDTYKTNLDYIEKMEGKWGYMPPEKMQFYLKYLSLDGKVDIAKYYTNDFIGYANDFEDAKIQEQAKNYKA
jgi:NitT/TauT family transport system substrate-binding protein